MKDFCASSDYPTIQQEIDLIYQQIDMLFDTMPTEVLGYSDYGTDFFKYLYDLRITNQMIENYIYSKLESTVYWFGWSFDVNVELLEGTENDIILVKIHIYNSTYSKDKIYKITH